MNVLILAALLLTVVIQLAQPEIVCKCFSYGYNSALTPNLGDTYTASNIPSWACDSTSTCTPQSGEGCITIRTPESLIGFCGHDRNFENIVKPTYLTSFQDERTSCHNLANQQSSYCECDSGNYCNYPRELHHLLSAAPNLHPKVYITLAVAVMVLAKLL